VQALSGGLFDDEFFLEYAREKALYILKPLDSKTVESIAFTGKTIASLRDSYVDGLKGMYSMVSAEHIAREQRDRTK
jgi:hypothetical protein